MRLIAVKIIDIKDLEDERENEHVETDFMPTNTGTSVPFS